jgi:hypothetical protein
MKKTKKNLYGSDHVLTKNKKIETLLLYWELYYNYQLPKEKQQYLDTDTYVIDRSGCW